MRLIDADKLILSLNDNYLANSPTGNETLEVQNYRKSMCEGLEIAMATAEAAPTVSGWVSVKDRMPDELDCYLVSLINHGGIDIDVYHPDEKVFSHNRQYVEYWMAIPSFTEPPEVSENG